jgi:hypothetical protein
MAWPGSHSKVPGNAQLRFSRSAPAAIAYNAGLQKIKVFLLLFLLKKKNLFLECPN